MIKENTFYQNNKEKQDFEKSPTKLGNAFWINIIGFIALYDLNKNNARLHAYFQQKVQLSNVNDNSNDIILIIKILEYKKLIKPSVAQELTKLLARIKKLSDIKIDQLLFRKLLKKIPISKVKPSAKLKPFITDYKKSVTSLQDMIDPLYNFAKQQKICEEYKLMCRIIKKNNISTTDFTTPKIINTPIKINDTNTDTNTDTDIVYDDEWYQNFKDNTPNDKEFPFVKNNKELVKLFLLKFVNIDYMYKKRPNVKNMKTQLKKFDTSAKEIMSIINEKDIEDMHKNNFPINNKNLSYYYDNNKLFSPISDTFFNQYLNFDRFYEIFPYKYLIKKKYQKNIKMSEINIKERLTIINNWDNNDILDMKQSFNDFSVYNLQILSQYPNIWKMIKNILIVNDELFLKLNHADLKIMLKNKILYDLIKNWYNITSDSYKNMFKSIVYNADMLYMVKFIDNNINKDEMLYISFLNWIYNKTSSRIIDFNKMSSFEIEKWLKSKNKLESFKKDFEDPKYDKITIITERYSKYSVRYINVLCKFINERKRPFVFGNKDQCINFVSSLDNIEEKCRPVLAKHFLNYIKQFEKFIQTYLIPSSWENYLNDNNYFDLLDHVIGYMSMFFLKNISVFFIEKNIDKFILLSNRIDLYKEIYQKKQWIVFTVNDMKDLLTKSNTITFTREFADMIFGNTTKEPKDRWQQCKDFLIKKINENPNMSDGLIDGKQLLNDEYQTFLLKNFKDRLKTINLINTCLRYYSLNEKEKNKLFDFLIKIFDNEQNLTDFISNHISNHIFKNTTLITLLSKLTDINSIKTLMNNNLQISNVTIPSLLNDWNFLNIIIDKLDDIKVTNEDFDEYINTVFKDKKLTTVINGIRKNILYSAFVKDIYDDNKSLIQPIEKMTQERINQVLKFNNVSIKLPTELRKKKNEKLKPYLNRIKNNIHKMEISKPLHIDKIEETEEELEIKSAEYLKYYNGNHGNSAIEFLESFNVDMPNDDLKQWMIDNPEPTVIPGFHGTGSIGASMILRFGFKIIPAGDKSIVGRMLGDGIYISNIIEKAAQYIGDTGFSRRRGTIGYILETECYIGQKEINHKVAGDSRDRILSPEWVIFDPRSQIKIVKAHKVKMTSKKYINYLKNKHKVKINENKYFGKKILNENKLMNMITYIFYDGNIPDENGTIIPFEDFETKYKNNSNIIVTYGQYGPEVNIKTNADIIGSVHIPTTLIFKEQNPENLYDKYLSIMDDILNDYED